MNFGAVTRSGLLALLVTGGVLSSSTALARPTMPQEIIDALGIDGCDPLAMCIICHPTNPGSPPADKPFVTKLKDDYGFRIRDDGGNDLVGDFMRALEASEIDGNSDTDGDGRSDREELILGFDPNPNGVRLCGEGAPPEPTYGCAARVAPRGGIDGAALGAAALVALALLRTAFARRRSA